uniref:Protein amnionless n=1 Tax=Oncorhynchus tshawytscha TaxID=74940 RepID=A0AAZ3PX79_ONCTS
ESTRDHQLHNLGTCALTPSSDALYKQWIPDTNYENKTNWDKGSVPCGNDIVQFSAQRKVSVYVETVHSVQEIQLPVDGEFILPSGRLHESLDDLEKGRFLFSVHEESVPCQYDNVLFRAGSSFRVDTSNQPSPCPDSEFTHYLGSHSGRLQFHGTSSPSVGASGCSDASGCDCGNSANHNRICGTVTCAPMSCKPLYPIGHCCDVCSAIVTIQYSSQASSLSLIENRLQHLFLGLPLVPVHSARHVKVLKSQYFLESLVSPSWLSSSAGVIKMPTMPTISIPSHRQQEKPGGDREFTDHGFENPIFDKPTMMPEVPGIYGTEAANSISLSRQAIAFNPAYDENETSIDFSA